MTDDELAAMRARTDRHPADFTDFPGGDRQALLAEVDRLRKLLADRSADDELSRAIERQRAAGLACFFCSNLGYYTTHGPTDCYCTCPIGRGMQAEANELADWQARPSD